MTTSGITTTELSRDTIIKAARRKFGVTSTPTTQQYTDGAEALNNLVARYQILGMPLWAMKTQAITMVADQETYTIGVGQTTNTAFPLRVIQAWIEPTSGGSRQILEPNTITDFYSLPLNSDSSGTPSQYMYQPFINFGILHLWPQPDSTTVANKTLTISYMSPFDEFSASGNTPYFPKEWNDALIYNLAVSLAPEYGVPLQDRSALKKEADIYLDMALDFGNENVSHFFAPKRDR